MRRTALRYLGACALACLAWGGLAGRLSAQVTVTATASAASPDPVPVGVPAMATLTATANNAPPPHVYGGSSPVKWTWSYTVQYASSPGAWGPPPQGAGYSVGIAPPPSTNPSSTTLGAYFSVAGYWRVTGLTATYTDPSNNVTASGAANDVDVTVVAVTLPSQPLFVTVGQSVPAGVKVSPDGAAADVTLVMTNPTAATATWKAHGAAVTGVAVGMTQLQAKVGQYVLASREVMVLDVTYSPASGPVLTQLAFNVAAPVSSMLSPATQIKIQGYFEPEGFPDARFAVTYDVANVLFNSSQPNQVSLAVAEVFPAQLLNSKNAGVAMALTGTVTGQATLSDGAWRCTVPVTFTITPSAFIGRLVNGKFKEATDSLPVWQANSSQDLVGVNPALYLYGQIRRPVNAFTQGGPDGPPPTLTAQLRSFYGNGKAVSPGVSAQFTLVSSTSSFYVYQSPPFILIANPAYEGVQSGLMAVAGAKGTYLQIVRLPP